MSADQTGVPAPVHTAFLLYLGAAALAVTNAVLQLTSGISPPLVLVGAAVEAVLFVAFGRQMHNGKLWARLTMLSLALVFTVYSLAGLAGLIMLMRAGSDDLGGLRVLLALLWSAKVVVLVSATWLMYRPANQAYFH